MSLRNAVPCVSRLILEVFSIPTSPVRQPVIREVEVLFKQSVKKGLSLGSTGATFSF